MRWLVSFVDVTNADGLKKLIAVGGLQSHAARDDHDQAGTCFHAAIIYVDDADNVGTDIGNTPQPLQEQQQEPPQRDSASMGEVPQLEQPDAPLEPTPIDPQMPDEGAHP